MRIDVYGPGCPNCRRLEANTKAALDDLGLEAQVSKIEDITAIAASGVMRTPALGVDGELVLQGRVPTPSELAELLKGRGRE